MPLLLLFLAYEFFKLWKYVADSNKHVCLCVQAISDFVLIDKRVLNPDMHRHAATNGMGTARAVSQCFRNITKAKHQHSCKVLLPTVQNSVKGSKNYFTRGRNMLF